MRVADDILRVTGTRGGSIYLTVEDDGLMLIDTGVAHNAERIFEFIRRIGRTPGELRRIVLTHADIDHIGSVAELKARTFARVAIHRLDAPVLTGEQPPQKGGWPMRVVYRILGFQPASPDILLEHGDIIGRFRVLHVPGHTPGSIALRRDDGVLFSGDALQADAHGRLHPPALRLAYDARKAALSAENLQALGFTALLPGHGTPVVRQPEGVERPAYRYPRSSF